MKSLITVLTILTFAATAFPLPLDSVLARGDSCLNVVWTPDSANTRQSWYTRWSAQCTSSPDTSYRHCDFLPGTSYRGIAYSYGGRDAYFDFRAKLSIGRVAGSHSCHYDSYVNEGVNIFDSVAGTDCSGFVCYVWNEPRVPTGMLASNYPAISKSELAPGDILVKAGSHAVLIVEAIDQTNFLIWEASSTYHGCRERVINVTASPWSEFNYVARRNSAIAAIAVRTNSQRASDPSYRITTSQGGRRISLNLARPFSGIMELRNAAGQAVCRQTISAAAGTTERLLENPLAGGMYVSVLRNNSGAFGTPVVFMVIK